MVCKKCSQLIPDDSLFCPYCGAKIEASDVVEKSADLPVPKSKKKGKPVLVVLVIMLLLVGVASGYYYHSYTQAKAHALVGNFTEADSLLIARPITKLHDPQLLAYEDAGLTALSGDYQTAEKQYQALAYQDYADSEVRVLWCRYNGAKELFKTDKLEGFKIFVELRALDYISENELEGYRSELYHSAIELYHSGKHVDSKPIFMFLMPYMRSQDYVTLIEKRDYNKIFDLLGFEDSKAILQRNFMNQFMEGEWRSEDKKYIFTQTNYADGSSTTDTNLPSGNVSSRSYYFANNIFTAVLPDTDSERKIYRFSITSKNSVRVFCYADAKTYYLFRQ